MTTVQAAESSSVTEGKRLLAAKRFAEADASFRKAIAVDAKDADAFEGLGEALRGQGKFDESANAFSHAADLLVATLSGPPPTPKVAVPSFAAPALVAPPANAPLPRDIAPPKASPVAPAATPAAVVAPAVAAVAPPQVGDQVLSGLYLQYTYSGSWNHYWFRPDGNLYIGVPPGGLERSADFTALQKRDAKRCGTYVIANGKITIQLPDRPPQINVITVEGADARVVKFNGPALILVGKFKEHEAIEGNYEGGGSAGGGGAFISVASHTHLHSDGSFESGSVSGFDVTGARFTAGGGGEEQAKGKFDLSGNTLTLTFASGKSIAFTAFPYPRKDESPPNHMSINGQMCKLIDAH